MIVKLISAKFRSIKDNSDGVLVFVESTFNFVRCFQDFVSVVSIFGQKAFINESSRQVQLRKHKMKI